MPDDLLKRIRMLAAIRSSRSSSRVTMEAIHAEALRRGVEALERLL